MSEQATTQFLQQHKPTINNKFDALALVIHSIFQQSQYQCIGTNESEASVNVQSLPNTWSSTASAGLYTFVYTHNKLKDTKIIVKILKINNNTVSIHVVQHNTATQQSESYTCDINVDDYINSDLNDTEHLVTDITGLNILLNNNILHKIIPPQSNKSTESNENTSTAAQQRTQQSLRDPTFVPTRPYGAPPNINDEDDIDDPLRVSQPRRPGQHGDFGGDLNPFGTGNSGNIMGPDNFPFDVRGGQGHNGMQPRYDPFNEPDNDDLRMPGFGGNPPPTRGGLPRRGGMGNRGGAGMNPFGNFGPGAFM